MFCFFAPTPRGGVSTYMSPPARPRRFLKGGGGAGGASFGVFGLEPHKAHYVKFHSNPLILFASWVLAIRYHFLFSVWRRPSRDQRQLSDFAAFLL